MAEIKLQHSYDIFCSLFPLDFYYISLVYFIYGGRRREWAAFLFSSIYSFSTSVPFICSPFPHPLFYFEIIWMWMGYNPWSIDLFHCFPGMYLTLLEIIHCLACRGCSEQRYQMWVNPGKEHLLWWAHWTPGPPLPAPAPALPGCVSVVLALYLDGFHSTCLLQDLADRAFLLLLHVERKYSLW